MKARGKRTSSLSKKEQIQVILHEYDALKAGMTENLSRQQTFITIWITFLLAFLGFASQYRDNPLILIFPIGFLILLTMEASRQYSLTLTCLYIKVLERQINELAGKPLLLWEIAGTTIYLDKTRLELPTSKRPIFNSHLVVAGSYYFTGIAIFSFGLYQASWYVYNSTHLSVRTVIVALYALFHILGLVGIIYSRLVQEQKVFKGYEKKMLDMKKVSSNDGFDEKSPWR